MNRLLMFHTHKTSGNVIRMSPSAYYMDADYNKVAVRIYAENAPSVDAKIDIFCDGVSIFKNRNTPAYSLITGVDVTQAAETAAILTSDQQSEEMAGDFTSDQIEEGSWVYCELVDAGGGSGFTVQLELHQLSEGDDEDD